jgi:putative transposase
MARSLRIEFDGAWYHVFSRGQRREAIFINDRDRERFMELLEEMVEKHGVRIHGYVLMGNHYHLLVDTPRGNLVKAMKGLNTGYANWFKAKHKVSGAVLEGRYHAILVDGDAYLAQVSAYIHLNPVRAGKAEWAEGYAWGSYRYYMKPRQKPDWLTTEAVLGMFGGRTARYRRYVEQWMEEPKLTRSELYGRCGILGDGTFLEKVRKMVKGKLEREAAREVTGAKRLRGVEAGEIRRLLESMGPKGEQDLFGERKGNVWRKLLIYGLRRYTDLKGIGVELGMAYPAVAKAYKRFTLDSVSRPTERKLKEKLDAAVREVVGES